MNKLMAFATCACLISLQSTAMAGHESDGGNEVKSNFISWARVIHDAIAGDPTESSILTTTQLDAFGKAIDSIDVEPIDTDGPFNDNEGNPVDARVVPDPNHPGQMRIELLQSFWQTASPRDSGVCRLVFHEYLRVIGVDNQTDEDRNAVSYKWHDVCDYYTASAVKNADFELNPIEGQTPQAWNSVGYGTYSAVTDTSIIHTGQASVRIEPKSDQQRVQDFGGIVQCIDAQPFIGSLFQLTGYLRLENVRAATAAGAAGLWARVDSSSGQILAFDNMFSRPYTGTMDWTPAIVALGVDSTASRICFGVVMQGLGTVWADDLKLEKQ